MYSFLSQFGFQTNPRIADGVIGASTRKHSPLLPTSKASGFLPQYVHAPQFADQLVISLIFFLHRSSEQSPPSASRLRLLPGSNVMSVGTAQRSPVPCPDREVPLVGPWSHIRPARPSTCLNLRSTRRLRASRNLSQGAWCRQSTKRKRSLT